MFMPHVSHFTSASENGLKPGSSARRSCALCGGDWLFSSDMAALPIELADPATLGHCVAAWRCTAEATFPPRPGSRRGEVVHPRHGRGALDQLSWGTVSRGQMCPGPGSVLAHGPASPALQKTGFPP